MKKIVSVFLFVLLVACAPIHQNYYDGTSGYQPQKTDYSIFDGLGHKKQQTHKNSNIFDGVKPAPQRRIFIRPKVVSPETNIPPETGETMYPPSMQFEPKCHEWERGVLVEKSIYDCYK
jgi:hypothetical protein